MLNCPSGKKRGLPFYSKPMIYLARPERFELPTNRFEADYSIQLSYGRLIDDVGYYFYPATASYADPVTFLLNFPSGKKKGLPFTVSPCFTWLPRTGSNRRPSD